jgi:HSP20 family molecular chaperone IbpA
MYLKPWWMQIIPRARVVDFTELMERAKKLTENRVISSTKMNNEHIFEVELPGYLKSEVSVKIKGGHIEVVARNAKRGEVLENLIVTADMEVSKISCKLTDGILIVKIPSIKSEDKYIPVE